MAARLFSLGDFPLRAPAIVARPVQESCSASAICPYGGGGSALGQEDVTFMIRWRTREFGTARWANEEGRREFGAEDGG